jgi:hypothetical protein
MGLLNLMMNKELAELILRFTSTQHIDGNRSYMPLLEMASSLRRSYDFAWAVSGECDFHFFQFTPDICQDDALVRRAIRCIDANIDRLWSSIPMTFKMDVDFLSFACVENCLLYLKLPQEVRRNKNFVERLMNYVDTVKRKKDSTKATPQLPSPPSLVGVCDGDIDWPSWITNQEIVETYMITSTEWIDSYCEAEMFICIILENPDNQSWCTHKWALDMCSRQPRLATWVLNCMEPPFLNLSKETSILSICQVRQNAGVVIGSLEKDVLGRVWHLVIDLCPYDILTNLRQCDVHEEDATLLTSTFRNKPKLFSISAKHIQRLPYVARETFSRCGLQIKNSVWIDNKDFVMLAVCNNGLALRHVSDRLRRDVDVQMAAVRQNGFALAYVPYDVTHMGGYRRYVLETAVQQNSAAAVFDERKGLLHASVCSHAE